MPGEVLTARTRAIALHTVVAVGPSVWWARAVILSGETDFPYWLVFLAAGFGMSVIIAALQLFIQLATDSPQRVHPIVIVMPATLVSLIPSAMLAERMASWLPLSSETFEIAVCSVASLALGLLLARRCVAQGRS
jgi:hypothetical protein